MPIVKQIKFGREFESDEEKIKEGLELTYTERHNLCLALSLHTLNVLKSQGIEYLEEEDTIPRTKLIVQLKRKKKKHNET